MKKITLFILLIIAFISTINATKSLGYIITNDGDTLYGYVKIPKVDMLSSSFIAKGFYIESFHEYVQFKELNSKRFKTYYPIDLISFNFRFRNIEYNFKRFDLEMKSIVNAQEVKPRFLQLIHQSKILLYRDIVKIYPYQVADKISQYSFVDYYLFSESVGLIKSVASKEYKTLQDLLITYDCEKAFLKKLPSKIQFNEVHSILNAYEKWLSEGLL